MAMDVAPRRHHRVAGLEENPFPTADGDGGVIDRFAKHGAGQRDFAWRQRAAIVHVLRLQQSRQSGRRRIIWAAGRRRQ
jgi:hypothetical protein